MPQSTINYTAPIGFEGTKSDTSIHIIRGAIERWSSDVAIPFGRAVTLLPNGKISPITAPGQRIVGIAISIDFWGLPLVPNGVNVPPPGYPPNTALNILTVGDMFIHTEDATNAGDSMLVRVSAAAAPKDQIGRFAKTAGIGLEVPTGAEIVAITASKGAGIVAVRVNTK